MSEQYSEALRTIQEHVGTPIHGALLVVLKYEEERLKEVLVDAELSKAQHAQGGVHALRNVSKIINPRMMKSPRPDGGGYLDV